MPKSLAILVAILAPALIVLGKTTPSPAARVPFSIFANARPLEPAQFDLNELSIMFPGFEHAEFDRSGFREIVLPFVYSDPNHLGDANEALAFSFLLCSDLNWGPGCYASRHAYYTFKQSRRTMRALNRGYDARRVIDMMYVWQATHAVGGTLVRSPGGYSGNIEIYDRRDRVVFSQSFDKPRSFFDLLGDASVAALTYFGPRPSDALAKFLHQPRCKDMRCIAELGSAAFMAQDSPEEFGVYDEILSVDPDFAEVRYWAGLRHYWLDRDERAYCGKLALVLESRLDAEALRGFEPALCPDPALAAKYPQWLDQAEALVGKDNPAILQSRIKAAVWGQDGRAAVVHRAMKVAAHFPNDRRLLTSLAYQFVRGGDVPADYEMAASLEISGLLDNYQSANDVASWEGHLRLADDCLDIGRPDIAMESLSVSGPSQPRSILCCLTPALCQGGRYDEALEFYHLVGAPGSGAIAQLVVPYAAFAAAVTNKKDHLDQLLRIRSRVLALAGLTNVFQGYDDYLAGHGPNPRQYVEGSAVRGLAAQWGLLLAAQMESESGKSHCERDCEYFAYAHPQDRLFWPALDAYARRNSLVDAAAFYDYLGWFYPDDPWVADAVADYRHRSGGREFRCNTSVLKRELEKAVATLPLQSGSKDADWRRIPTPWRVAAGIHQLIRENRLDDATILAGLNIQLQVSEISSARQSLSFTLMRKVEDAMLAR